MVSLKEIENILKVAEAYVTDENIKKDVKYIKEEMEFGLSGGGSDVKKIMKEMEKVAEKIQKYSRKDKVKKLEEKIREFKILVVKRKTLV